MSRTFDRIIIGAGQAGPSLAGRLTAAEMTVALVDRHLVGGTCVNTGCMPTKTLVASAYGEDREMSGDHRGARGLEGVPGGDFRHGRESIPANR